jgi:hypothetical protein
LMDSAMQGSDCEVFTIYCFFVMLFAQFNNDSLSLE